MDFKLYKIEGYEAAIMALRMSKGKYYSWEKARDVQELVARVVDSQGFIQNLHLYRHLNYHGQPIERVREFYEKDVAEFKRLLGLTMNNAMQEFTHHTLMKYIDLTFITEGLHRGAQDDLDAHAIAFNNRITRYSTRLAEIEGVELSEWYRDKLIPFSETPFYSDLPEDLHSENGTYEKTPFGYVLDRYAQVPAKSGLAKDVQRGGIPLGLASNAIWKIDLASLRYVYHMRSKLTKANPELKLGMEMLADQIEAHLPVFGEHFRHVYTDSKKWAHTNTVRTITSGEYQQFKAWQKLQQETTM